MEVMVALLVLGTFISGACRLALTAKEWSDQARLHYQAINIGKNRLERLKVMEFDQIDLATEQEVRVNASGLPDSSGWFQRTTTVSLVTNDLKEVHVKVEIQDRKALDFDGAGEEIKSCVARFQTSSEA